MNLPFFSIHNDIDRKMAKPDAERQPNLKGLGLTISQSEQDK